MYSLCRLFNISPDTKKKHRMILAENGTLLFFDEAGKL